MEIADKFGSEQLVNVKASYRLKLWFFSLVIALITFGVSYLYYQFSKEGATGSRLVSELTADTGTLLIIISFLFSPILYFFNFLDRKLIYRKYLGLVGFYITLIHIYISVDFAMHNPTISFRDFARVWSFLLGIVAMSLFFQMTILSNDSFVKIFGSKAQRIYLRLAGYGALIIVVIHFWLRKSDGWQKWLSGNGVGPVPPLSFVVLIFSVVVVVLRLLLWLKTSKRTNLPAS